MKSKKLKPRSKRKILSKKIEAGRARIMGEVIGLFKNTKTNEFMRLPVDKVIHSTKKLYPNKKYKTYIDNDPVYLIFIRYI